MTAVTKEVFYSLIGNRNVHPYIVSDRYPYKMEWRTPSREVIGLTIPEIGSHPHIHIDRYFINDAIIFDCRETVNG